MEASNLGVVVALGLVPTGLILLFRDREIIINELCSRGESLRDAIRSKYVDLYIPHREGTALPELQETIGGIGTPRSQLGAFRDGLAPALCDRIGQHPNGLRSLGGTAGIEAGAIVSVAYRAPPPLLARKAEVLALFEGPRGTTADVARSRATHGWRTHSFANGNHPASHKDFLVKTIGYFRDEQVAFVQTPQDSFNIDPLTAVGSPPVVFAAASLPTRW